MKLAAKEAAKSTQHYKLGAVIARNNKPLVKAHNKAKTHPRGVGKFSTLHAECAAIIKAQKMGINLRGAKIYVYRHNGNLAKPCADCQRLIEEAGIKEVIHT